MGIVKKTEIDGNIRCLINSTNILETVYNVSNKELIITFLGGRVHKYKNITQQIYKEFEQSESHGKSFWKLFKSLPSEKLQNVDTKMLITELNIK